MYLILKESRNDSIGIQEIFFNIDAKISIIIQATVNYR